MKALKWSNTQMIPRQLGQHVTQLSKQYPVLTVTGPRQSGKTTLVRTLFPDKKYVSLEDLDEREFAQNDPRLFLERFPEGCIIDEAQYVPGLFSYIQTRVDETRKTGEFILTGSQNFLLLEKVSQSLAGRVAIFHLLPLSNEELILGSLEPQNPFDLIFKGFYPRIYDQNLDPTFWYKNYMTTYIERDVRSIKNITDLSKFQNFVRICAGRVGQLLNLSAAAGDAGIDQATAKSWLSLLEASFILFTLKPHYINYNRRLVKQPKVYFYDTGLLCYLLGLEKPEQIISHYMKGPLFENYVILEMLKKRYNLLKEPNIYFWRDSRGHEIDVIIETGQTLTAVEIKGGKTINQDFFKTIEYWKDLSGQRNSYLVYAGDEDQKRHETTIVSWKNVAQIPEVSL